MFEWRPWVAALLLAGCAVIDLPPGEETETNNTPTDLSDDGKIKLPHNVPDLETPLKTGEDKEKARSVDAGWFCDNDMFDSGGECDCGCGVFDPDCISESEEVCQTSNCGPKAVRPGQNWLCGGEGTVPVDFTCNGVFFGNGDGCDCGCGALDEDCTASTAETCGFSHCEEGLVPDPSMNWLCVERENPDGGMTPTAPLIAFACDMEYYGTDDGCDCGCATMDPDCATLTDSACEYEHCAGDLVPESEKNWNCVQSNSNPVPDAWTCSDGFYNDNDGCDCGCGVIDPDCKSDLETACRYEYCDSSEVVTPDANWTCTAKPADNGSCDWHGTPLGCMNDADCPAGKTCQNACYCVGVFCADDSECPAGSTCDARHRCEPI